MNADSFRHALVALLAGVLLCACVPSFGQTADYQDGFGMFVEREALDQPKGLPLPFPLNRLHTGTWYLPERPGVYLHVQVRDSGPVFGQSLNAYLNFDRIDFTDRWATWAGGSATRAYQDVPVPLNTPQHILGQPSAGFSVYTLGTATVRGICVPARLDVTISIPPRLPIIYRFHPQILAYGDPCAVGTAPTLKPRQ